MAESFDYATFKAEFKRGKRRAAHWWVGRFWAQDVVDALGRSAAEFTTLPWSARELEAVYPTPALPVNGGAESALSGEELRLTRRLLRSAVRDMFIQELLSEVFSELAAETAARHLEELRAIRQEWVEMLTSPPAPLSIGGEGELLDRHVTI